MTQTPEPETHEPADGAALPVTPTPDQPTSAVDDVLAQVRERGFITTGEIFAAFPDLEPDADELRDLWEMFESRGIKVLDEIAEELKLEDQRRSVSGASATPTLTPPAPPARRIEPRPSSTPRAGAASRRAPDDDADPDLLSMRAAQRPTHSESGSFDPVR